MTTASNAKPILARFNELVPYQSQHADNGIPREVMEYLAANKVFPVVSPPGLVGRNALAPLRGWPSHNARPNKGLSRTITLER